HFEPDNHTEGRAAFTVEVSCAPPERVVDYRRGTERRRLVIEADCGRGYLIAGGVFDQHHLDPIVALRSGAVLKPAPIGCIDTDNRRKGNLRSEFYAIGGAGGDPACCALRFGAQFPASDVSLRLVAALCFDDKIAEFLLGDCDYRFRRYG